jgi:hypothetical protein
MLIPESSVVDIDIFCKAVVSNNQCQIRLKTGEPVIRSFGKNNLDAIRNLKKLIDQLIDESSTIVVSRDPILGTK